MFGLLLIDSAFIDIYLSLYSHCYLFLNIEKESIVLVVGSKKKNRGGKLSG